MYGVPQGSKLGPILYIIYANELITILKNSTTFAYADDTAILVSHENIEEEAEIMQNELNTMTKWCHDNGLIINATKTKIIHFRPRHIPRTHITPIFHNTQCLHRISNNTIDSCTTKIELVESYKYLGVYLDEFFKWKTHTDITKTIRICSVPPKYLFTIQRSKPSILFTRGILSKTWNYRMGNCNILQNFTKNTKQISKTTL